MRLPMHLLLQLRLHDTRTCQTKKAGGAEEGYG